MNIFLLEDDVLQQQRLERILKHVIAENKWNVSSFVVTSKPEYLLKKARETVGNNIYFLDIEIHNNRHRGLELAKEIRSFDFNGVLSFVTTHSEFAPITYAYEVYAFDFIDKEWENGKIAQHVEKAVSQSNRIGEADNRKIFFFENQHTTFQVPFSDIYYFETTEISHKLRLVCKRRLVDFYANLSEIKKMDEYLFQTHRSFVVNLQNISEVSRSDGIVHFSNDYSCMVAHRKIKPLLSKMYELNLSPAIEP
ncbi:two-component system, LytTR family, response regulator AgrA [Enterococcus sp. AZ194]|uniref:response regulator transcription factor n=1 Tax=Enterococcus sp. AZ194 TaxID=2774629 RepID=UPI003F1FBA7E